MGPEDISTLSVLKTEAYPPQSKLMLAVSLLLLVASLSAQHCYSSDDSTPSPGLTAQRCGTDNTMYYCPMDESCHPREEHCTLASNCIDRHEVENKCYKSEIKKAYTIYLGHAFPVAAGSSLSEHQFIQYRGFTYEFTPRYGVQILDVNDPDYKYLNQRNITRNGIQNVGHSYCTWLDTTLCAERGGRKATTICSLENVKSFPLLCCGTLPMGYAAHLEFHQSAKIAMDFWRLK